MERLQALGGEADKGQDIVHAWENPTMIDTIYPLLWGREKK